VRFVRVIALSVMLCGGCVTDGPAPEPRPQPRVVREPPGLTPESIVLSAEPFPIDTDDNGFADTFRVSAFLFPDPRKHPLPIHADGTFIFTLTDENEQRVARWELGQTEVDRARVRPLVGPGHLFVLSLLDVTTDRISSLRGNLTCEFIPEGGAKEDAIRARGTATLRIGPTGMAGVGG
jgi:hypothetical protein